jgi:hypothetical protein
VGVARREGWGRGGGGEKSVIQLICNKEPGKLVKTGN